MPAVQVRDFPEELYEELKVYAAKNHRSVAQQLIVATEQMLHPPAQPHSVRVEELRRGSVLPWDEGDEQERQARIEKRKAIFERLNAIADKERKRGTRIEPTTDEIVAMIREGRDELDARIPIPTMPVAVEG